MSGRAERPRLRGRQQELHHFMTIANAQSLWLHGRMLPPEEGMLQGAVPRRIPEAEELNRQPLEALQYAIENRSFL